MPRPPAPRCAPRSAFDLLPWADPYIAQLFAETEVDPPEHGEGIATQNPRSLPAADDASAFPARAPKDPDADEWDIRTTLAPRGPRTRRSESGRLLVRC
jgi:hypothetical protein